MRRSRRLIEALVTISLDIFVVIFNRRIADCDTLDALSVVDFADIETNVRVWIWDNSTMSTGNADVELPHGWQYRSLGRNESLACVYNYLVEVTTGEHVIFFDQDSKPDSRFFADIASSIRNVQADAFVPIIEHGDNVISPGRLLWFKGAKLGSWRKGSMLPRNFGAMMSGLCVSRRCLDRFGKKPFDERLRFYGVDTRFCRDLARCGGRACMLSSTLPHDSALRTTREPAAALERNIWLWQSSRLVFDRNFFERISVRIYLVWKIWSVARRPECSQTFASIYSKVFG